MSKVIATFHPIYEFPEEKRNKSASPIKYIINDNGCFNVISHCLDKDGYPRISRNGMNLRMSRYVWTIHNDLIIPKGYVIMHKCDNPQCINPDHLALGTPADNFNDMVSKGRCKLQNHYFKSILTIDETYYIKFLAIEDIKELAEKYGVNQDTIRSIKKGLTWKWLTVNYIKPSVA